MADPLHIQAPDGSTIEFPAGTSDDVIKGVMAKEYGGPKESASADVAKSGGIGLAKGVIGLAGFPGDMSNLLAQGSQYASNFIADKTGLDRGPQIGEGPKTLSGLITGEQPKATWSGNFLPTSGGIQNAIESQTGEFYKPKTTAGEYTQTAGEFAPALFGGEGTLIPRAVEAIPKLFTRVAVPSVTSETAGQLTKGTPFEPWARVAGGILGGSASPGAVKYSSNLVQGGADGMSRGASRHLVDALSADSAPAVQQRMGQLGSDAMLADAGPAFLGKAQGATLNSDEGRSILGNALTARNEGTNQRIMGDVNRALGPAEDPQTVTNAIREHRTNVDNRAYPAALGNAPDVQTAPILQQIDDMIPRSVGMERRALTNLREMMMTTERRPLLDAQGHPQYDNLGNERFRDVPVSQNDAEVLHKIKGELDNVIEYDAPGLGVPAAALTRQQGALKHLRGELNGALEDQVPGYLEANRQSAALARRGTAVDLGTQYLGSGKTTASPGRFADEFTRLEPGEQIAFAKGSRGNIERVLGTKANDLQALRGELQGEGGWNTDKIATVHGQPAADELAGSVDRNLKFRDTYNKVVENSQTAQRQAAARAMKPEPSSETPLLNPNMSLTGFAATLGKKTANAALNAMRPDPTKSYGEVARVLSAQGSQRDRHLAALVDALSRKQANAKIGSSVVKNALVSALLAGSAPSDRQSR
jgi:hypothetical protein